MIEARIIGELARGSLTPASDQWSWPDRHAARSSGNQQL